MARKRQYAPLRVLLNNRLVGHLSKEPGGGIEFLYAESWLAWDRAIPVSLSLPLREDAYKGEPVVAVFENLLPDSEGFRRRIAEKVGANGTDSYSLLSRIGRDRVGALQFIPEDDVAAYPFENNKQISSSKSGKLCRVTVISTFGLKPTAW